MVDSTVLQEQDEVCAAVGTSCRLAELLRLWSSSFWFQTKHLKKHRANSTLEAIAMRRRALDYVCATCRHCAQSRTVLNKGSRRYVQISATPSSQEPQQTLDAKEESSPGAGRSEMSVRTMASSLKLTSSRRALRNSRQHLLPPLRVDLAVPKPVHAKRDTARLQWQARERTLPHVLTLQRAGIDISNRRSLPFPSSSPSDAHFSVSHSSTSGLLRRRHTPLS